MSASAINIRLQWRHGTIKNSLAHCLTELTARISPIQFSYLEWRPGAGFVKADTGAAPVLVTGVATHDQDIPLDELRLFGSGGGLHAINDAGLTRWMQWRVAENAREDGQDAQAGDAEPITSEWTPITVEKVDYPILVLDGDGARRFGLASGLPEIGDYTVEEYRRDGELFCWNLEERKTNG